LGGAQVVSGRKPDGLQGGKGVKARTWVEGDVALVGGSGEDLRVGVGSA
jgi:hypothetical protein